ncbi:MAG: signal transduction histidine kinase [Ulvibacter sp.]|jgi:signal transduction histidine kinase
MDSKNRDILEQGLFKEVEQNEKICLLCRINNDNPYFIEIIYLNQKFINYFGYDPDNIIGEGFDSILDHDDDNLTHIVEYNNIAKNIAKVSKLNFSLDIYNVDNHPEKFEVNFDSISKYNSKYCLFSLFSGGNSVEISSKKTSSGQGGLVHNLERVLRSEKLLRVLSDLMLKDEPISEIAYKALKALCNNFKIDRAILCQFNGQDVNLICEFCGDNTLSIVNCPDSNDRFEVVKRYFNFHNSVFPRLFVSKETENVIVEDISHDEVFYDIKDICSQFHIASQFCLSTPIDDNSNMGLFLHQGSIKKWNNEEVEIISTISNQLSVAIQKSVYLDKVMESNRELLKKSTALKNSLNEEKKMRMIQNEFIAMASHEFKTPLQIIDSSREILLRRLRGNKLTAENGGEDLLKIKNAILRLHNLISSTLDLSQIAMSDGDLDPNIESVSIKGLIYNIIEQNKEIYVKKNIDIQMSIDKLPDEYFADEKMLDHCLTNIIGNAVKYSPENSVIKILGTKVESKVLIKVVDSGMGIPKADLKKVGEKFFRAKNTLKISGTGIGLYLTKYFIKLHGGEVLIQSIEGRGTEVTTVLPVKINEE